MCRKVSQELTDVSQVHPASITTIHSPEDVSSIHL
jgi:hypothetical protein